MIDWDIYAAGSDIGSNQEAQFAVSYPLHHFVTRALREIRTDLIGVVTITLQYDCNVVHPGFCIAKNYRLLRGFHFDDTHLRAVFIHTRCKVVNMLGVFYMNVIAA